MELIKSESLVAIIFKNLRLIIAAAGQGSSCCGRVFGFGLIPKFMEMMRFGEIK